jgi:CBS domain-containing protein
MNVGEVMSRNPIAVPADAELADALRLMLDHGISGLPVVDDKAGLAGILTEGDLLRRAEIGTAGHRSRWLDLLATPGRLAGEYVRTHARRVGEIMTRHVVSVDEATPLEEVVRLMERHRIKRVPVLRDGALVGIVSRADLLRALARLLPAAPTAAAGDEAIRRRVLTELAAAPWAPRGLIVTVESGVVTLDGVILDEKTRGALRVAAENVPGVKAVLDRLVWVEPVSGMVVEAPAEKENGP